MLNDSDQGPLRGVRDIDWKRHAGEGGEAIPDLLEQLHTSEDPLGAALELAEVLAYPAPGHTAAAGVVSYLVRIALDPGTERPYDTLTLLHEFAAGHPGDCVPRRRDIALWRDEVASAVSVGDEEAVQRYQKWLAEAPDEQAHRRHSTQLRALEGGGVALLAAELATYDAIRERLPRLMRLIHDTVLRNREFVPQEAANLFGLFPEASGTLIPLLRAYERLTDIPEEDLPSAVFAVGMLADTEDEGAAEWLSGKLFETDEATRLGAALGLVHQRGDKAPEPAAEALLEHLTSPDLDQTFPSPYADVDDHTFAMLSAGLLADRARAAKSDAYGVLFAVWDSERDPSLLVADALEFALGPRSKVTAEPNLSGVDAEGRRALQAVASVPEEVWDGVAAMLQAWRLPRRRQEFAAAVGADDDPAAESSGDKGSDGSGGD
jgi:hypothetical protein